MANVSAGWRLFVTLMDNGGNKTTKSFELTSADETAAAADSAAVVAALLAVTDAVLIDYASYELFVNDAVTYPASGVEIENQAQLLFDIVDHPEKRAVYSIPAPKPGIFVATSGAGANIIDTADAAVIAFRDLFRTAGESYISDGEVAETLISGKRVHRKSRRG